MRLLSSTQLIPLPFLCFTIISAAWFCSISGTFYRSVCGLNYIFSNFFGFALAASGIAGGFLPHRRLLSLLPAAS
jgi:hypothetical protein